MKHTAIAFAAAAFLSVFSGCVVEERRGGPPPWAPAHGYRRQVVTYYYYPDIEVYYYPNVRRYYWVEGGEWRFGVQAPRHYVVENHRRVVLDLDHEPHTQHAKVKNNYPPGQIRKALR